MDRIPSGSIPLVEAFCRTCERLWPEALVERDSESCFAGAQSARVDYELAKRRLLNAIWHRILSVEVWTAENRQRFSLLANDLKNTDPDTLFLSSIIVASQGDPLASYRGRTPFVSEAQFATLLETVQPVAGGTAESGPAIFVSGTDQPRLPGRPTAMPLIDAELELRIRNGRLENGVGAQARALKSWLATAHPETRQLSAATIEINISSRFRAVRKLGKK